jgi:hypothetical protein
MCILKLVSYAQYTTTGEVHTGFWHGDLTEGDYLGDLGVEGRIMSK